MAEDIHKQEQENMIGPRRLPPEEVKKIISRLTGAEGRIHHVGSPSQKKYYEDAIDLHNKKKEHINKHTEKKEKKDSKENTQWNMNINKRRRRN